MTAPAHFPRFFVTGLSPCPYLEGKHERKVFTDLSGERADALNEALGRIGFRRSQNVAYRPSCLDCSACVSVRVLADRFEPRGSQKRNIRRNRDLVVERREAWATQEQYELLRRYLRARHPGGGMTGMDEMDYADMVEQSPVDTELVEYREPTADGSRGRLVGACLSDRQSDGLSMVYSFYDPEHEARQGLGNYIIMEHLARARRDGLPYVYLGYWVAGSRNMAYKTRFRPLERLGADGWTPLRFED